jgi:S-adenosylmethionine:tRNA ribosyltransferase-isomerase
LSATVERTLGHPRLVALAFDGSTVVRALEYAARDGRLHAGSGLATQRIGAATRLAVVDAILSGTHEPGTSHYELLRAFARDESLREAGAAFEAQGYRTHEFGDSVLIERQPALAREREHSHHALAA